MRDETKRQWKQWLDATVHGIKDELRMEREKFNSADERYNFAPNVKLK